MGVVATWQEIRRPITYPTDVDFASNGILRASQLRNSMAPGHGFVQLHPLASRAFDVLQFNCWNETGQGQQLTVVSLADGYRSLQRQEATFRARYTDRYNPITCTTSTKQWQGKTWWLKRGNAMAASPGTSNHGWGLALDAAWWVETGGKWAIKAVTSNKLAFGWLEQNVESHGFAWNNRTEAWHLEYAAGDALPERVTNLEHLFGITA
jgi:hypothetical protein